MNHQLTKRLDKVERKFNSAEIVRLWLKTLLQFGSLQEYLTSVLNSARPEDPLAKRRVVKQRRAGRSGSYRGDSDRALAQEECELTFKQNLVLELNCEVQRLTGERRERLAYLKTTVNLAGGFVDDAHDTVMARSLSEAHDALTDIMIDLEAIALTVKSMSRKFWNFNLLFRSGATALASGRRLASACADEFDRVAIRIRADLGRPGSALIGLATIDRELVAKSARARSDVLSKKLEAFAKASMLVSFGDVEEAKRVSGPYLGKHP